MQRNRIAHCIGGGSDKIYIACIRQQPSGEFAVIGKWGPRIGKIQTQIKGEYANLAMAEKAMDNLFHEKLRKGYKDIENVSYNGPVSASSVQQHLEAESSLSNLSVNPIEFDKAPVSKEEQARIDKINAGLLASRSGKIPLPVMRVRCINNLGIEDRFEQNVDVEYEATQANDKQMLTVTDMHGKKDDYFAERFIKA